MLEQQEYVGANFYEADFYRTNMTQKTFITCDFTGADFSDMDMVYGCRFEKCDFSAAKMNGVHFRNTAFLGCKFNDTRFFATIMEDCKMTGSSFAYTDFSSLSIKGGDWSLCEMRFAEFRKQTLTNVRFDGADLAESKFINCKIEGCTFSDTNVQKVSFYQSDIRSSDLSAVDLSLLDLRETKVDLEQCVLIAEAMGVQYLP